MYISNWEGKGWRFVQGHIKREDAYAQAKNLRRLSRAGGLRLNYRVEFTFGAGVYCVFERKTLVAKNGTGVLSFVS